LRERKTRHEARRAVALAVLRAVTEG